MDNQALALTQAEMNKRLVGNFIELTWNQGFFHLVKSLAARDFTYHASMVDMPMNLAGMETLIGIVRAAMDDFCVSVEEIVCEGNRVVTQSTFSGTLVKPLMGFQPVDKMVVLHAATFLEVRRNTIVSGNSVLDTGDLFKQVQRIIAPAKLQAIAF